MTTKKQAWGVRVAEDVRAALASLPTDDELKQVDRALVDLVSFFSAVRDRLRALPASDDVRRMREALEVVSEFLKRAEGDKRLGVALGFQKPSSIPRERSRQPTENIRRQAEQLVRRLGELPLRDIQNVLLDEKAYSIQVLQEAGRQLKIPMDPKLSKDELVDRIVKIGFANPRGYEGLRRPG